MRGTTVLPSRDPGSIGTAEHSNSLNSESGTMTQMTTPSRTTVDTAYVLTYAAGVPVSCTCAGCSYRGRCRHIAEHTNGGFLLYCDHCAHDVLNAVTYDAATSHRAHLNNTCTHCDRPGGLSVAPDFDARESRRSTAN